MKSGENRSSFSEKKTFKDYEICVYCPGCVVCVWGGGGEQGQINPGDKILIVTKMICYFFFILTERICYFDHTSYDSAISL